MRFDTIFCLAVYAALGLLSYLWLGSYTVFSWADPMVVVYMILWPFFLLVKVLFWVIVIAFVVLVIVLSFVVCENYKVRKARKNIKTIREYVDKKSADS